jgi:tight adherence protein B
MLGLSQQTLLILIAMFVLALLSLSGMIYYFMKSRANNQYSSNRMRSMVATQRYTGEEEGQGKSTRKKGSLEESVNQSTIKKATSAVITLEKKLYYADWKMPAYVFRLFQYIIGFFVFALVQIKFNIAIQLVSFFSGVAIMNAILNYKIKKRSTALDRDYPQFLISLVGLLKTGMNPMTGIAAALEGLEESSVLRAECELMLERLRYGVSEEQSIGSFAEDILHPEIELFVQALLLSRRVGGTLSDTLDRVSRQARRRQYFKAQAVASVALQRGSIWFILGIMVMLEMYLLYTYPKMVIDSIQDETGWQIWQTGFLAILFGVIWVRKVTEIKV